jgi:hypothetical protein
VQFCQGLADFWLVNYIYESLGGFPNESVEAINRLQIHQERMTKARKPLAYSFALFYCRSAFAGKLDRKRFPDSIRPTSKRLCKLLLIDLNKKISE